MRQFLVPGIVGWEERQANFSKVAALVNCLKVANFEHEKTESRKRRICGCFFGMELPRKKNTNIHVKRLIYFSGVHISIYTLWRKRKLEACFAVVCICDDNGDAISSVNNDGSEGEAQIGESDNMQLMEESPYLFLCPPKCHPFFIPSVFQYTLHYLSLVG